MNAKTPLDVINAYKEAYERANGKGVIITYWRGWYTIDGDVQKYRKIEIISMIGTLAMRAAFRTVGLDKI